MISRYKWNSFTLMVVEEVDNFSSICYVEYHFSKICYLGRYFSLLLWWSMFSQDQQISSHFFWGGWAFIIHMLCNVQYHFFQKKDLVIIHILSIKSNNPIRITYEIWLWYISGLSSIFSSILSSIRLSSTVILSSIYYVLSIIFPSYLHNSLIKSQHRSILSSIYYP